MCADHWNLKTKKISLVNAVILVFLKFQLSILNMSTEGGGSDPVFWPPPSVLSRQFRQNSGGLHEHMFWTIFKESKMSLFSRAFSQKNHVACCRKKHFEWGSAFHGCLKKAPEAGLRLKEGDAPIIKCQNICKLNEPISSLLQTELRLEYRSGENSYVTRYNPHIFFGTTCSVKFQNKGLLLGMEIPKALIVLKVWETLPIRNESPFPKQNSDGKTATLWNFPRGNFGSV